MQLNDLIGAEEKPLDHLVSDGGFCGIFRRVACVGDSLSSGEFEAVGADGKKVYLDFYDYSWGQYLARMAGLTAYNFSRGGMTAKEYCETWGGQNGVWDPEKRADAYILALGVNDLFGYRMEPGEMSDICPDDPRKNRPTFLGYYAQIIARYRAIQPHARFFLMTMPREESDDAFHTERKEAHARLLHELAAHYPNTYVLDFYRYAPVYDAAFKEKFYLLGHLNPAGYLLTARMVASYIDFIIRSHMADFRQIGLIETEYYTD